jgi:hypothetical protein
MPKQDDAAMPTTKRPPLSQECIETRINLLGSIHDARARWVNTALWFIPKGLSRWVRRYRILVPSGVPPYKNKCRYRRGRVDQKRQRYGQPYMRTALLKSVRIFPVTRSNAKVGLESRLPYTVGSLGAIGCEPGTTSGPSVEGRLISKPQHSAGARVGRKQPLCLSGV